ncbi:hypothetical protein FJR41_017545 [Dolichospermum planctonicum UHCC 0167]|nr:hypothetical protein [Dolichospermum planctonicum]MCW9682577.1 hypothetical protein [Dolichospermum planctonicum UHCC 0167]
MHWEALPDPDFPRPLAVDCVMLRKIEYKDEYWGNIARGILERLPE